MRLEHVPEYMLDYPMFSCQQAAQMLQLDDSTVRFQIKHKRLQATKIGPVWAISPREILRYGKEVRRAKCKH